MMSLLDLLLFIKEKNIAEEKNHESMFYQICG